MYSIIDIETTGLHSGSEKITEISIFLHDGDSIVDEFTTLINPERKIPYYIVQMTGINDRMVKDAPKFYEVAAKILEMTRDAVFVAHNASFDYNFVRSEFGQLGYDFRREKLCTVKLSRKLLPGRRSYSLGKLTAELGIVIGDRHRARGDALATVRLFEQLLMIEKDVLNLSLKGLNINIDRKIIRDLPVEPGVYYFYNDKGEVIYIGKSKNIRERVISHFTNNTSKREIDMRNQVAGISHELTGSELIALLLESAGIKKNKPVYNRAQRRTSFRHGLFMFSDEQGYIRFRIDELRGKGNPVTTFTTRTAAREHLLRMTEEYELCQKLCGLYETRGCCFHYTLHQCRGACIGMEPAEAYNERALESVKRYVYDHNSFLVIDRGRRSGEQSVVLVENGRYLGFGFADIEHDAFQSPAEVKGIITFHEDNRDVQQIIRQYLSHNKVLKIVPF
jgi:DNA polymerase-3 subunit epsilon